MDSYFQRVHGLPSEIVKLLFEFATLRGEIIGCELRPYNPPVIRPWNVVFFRNWQFILDQTDDGETYYVFDTENRVRVMYITM